MRKVGGKELTYPFSVDCSFNSNKQKTEDEQCDFREGGLGIDENFFLKT